MESDSMLEALNLWAQHFALAQGTITPTVKWMGQGGCRVKRAHAHTETTYWVKSGSFERTKTGRLRVACSRGLICVNERWLRLALEGQVRTIPGLMAHEVAHFRRGKRQARVAHGNAFRRQVRALCDSAGLEPDRKDECLED